MSNSASTTPNSTRDNEETDEIQNASASGNQTFAEPHADIDNVNHDTNETISLKLTKTVESSSKTPSHFSSPEYERTPGEGLGDLFTSEEPIPFVPGTTYLKTPVAKLRLRAFNSLHFSPVDAESASQSFININSSDHSLLPNELPLNNIPRNRRPLIELHNKLLQLNFKDQLFSKWIKQTQHVLPGLSSLELIEIRKIVLEKVLQHSFYLTFTTDIDHYLSVSSSKPKISTNAGKYSVFLALCRLITLCELQSFVASEFSLFEAHSSSAQLHQDSCWLRSEILRCLYAPDNTFLSVPVVCHVSLIEDSLISLAVAEPLMFATRFTRASLLDWMNYADYTINSVSSKLEGDDVFEQEFVLYSNCISQLCSIAKELPSFLHLIDNDVIDLIESRKFFDSIVKGVTNLLRNVLLLPDLYFISKDVLFDLGSLIYVSFLIHLVL
ncbi:hypothetical protein GEMRC1_007131 [Eukaryota sp. GEM-RC1]